MADVYCYPDSSVLKNKLGINDKEQLLMAEIRLVAIRLYQLQEHPIQGNFDLNHQIGRASCRERVLRLV